jgi:alpha-D-xyloside xylohydrolase
MKVRKSRQSMMITRVIFGVCALYGMLSAAAIPVTSVTKDASGVTFGMTPGSMRIDVCTDGIIRVRYCLQSTVPVDNNMSFLVPKTWSPVSFTQTETASDVTIATSKVQVKVNKSTGALTFLNAAGTTVLQETAAGGKSLTATTVNGENTYTCEQIFDSPADEGIYGLGSMHDGFINWHGMPEYLQQLNTHISIPMILSSKGYGILWASASRTYFNMPAQRINLSNGSGQFTTTTAGDYVFLALDGPLQQEIRITVNGTVVNSLVNTWHSASLAGKIRLNANATVNVSLTGGGSLYGGPLKNETKFTSRAGQTVDYYFFYGPTPDEAIAGYRLATGAASMFSKATYGFIQCRERYSSQAEILDNAYQFRNRKIPVDIIVQDWNYWGSNGWGSMMFDQGAYPNPRAMIDSLHKLNLGYMLSVWSNPQGGAVSTALQNYKISGTSFYDAFNPNARSIYWQYMNSNLFSLGIDAFWQDADEPEIGQNQNLETRQVNFGSGAVGGKLYTNAYPLFVSKTVYDGWRSTNSTKRVCVLSRSAFAGSQRFGTMCWNGDIAGIYDWFQRSIRAGLNFGMAGMPYWTTDIGGFFRSGSGQYTDATYNEMLTRWVQYGAFCPMFRIHGYQSQTEIWRYTSATLNAFMLYDNLRYRMLPYIYSLAGMVNLRGSTIMRGLVMDFWTDANVLDIGDQFMFGPAILVNPITSPGVTSRNVYLPSGTSWVNFWTGQATTGGQSVSARAQRDTIPLFVRAGSIIPLGPEMLYANQKKADTIELRAYPGANGSFTMYEDEGDNYNYETGKYALIPITYIDNPKNVIIGDRTGSFTNMDQKKVFNVVYVSSNHGTGEGKTATPDCQIIYTGTQTSCVPVSVAQQARHSIVSNDVSLRVVGDMFVLPYNLSEKTKEIAVYDCSGRLLHKSAARKNTIDVRKDFGLPAGVYIVKVKAIQ